jgi:hypothetical protein
MSPFFIALLALVCSTFRTRAAQQAEIVALRHQIAVLQQSAPPPGEQVAIKLSNSSEIATHPLALKFQF